MSAGYNFGNFSPMDPRFQMNMPGFAGASQGASNPLTAALSSYGSQNAPTSSVTPDWQGQKYGYAGLGFNLPTLDLVLGGLNTVGSLWNAFEQRKMAQKEFNFKKGVTETNLKNQIQSYNTALEDRSRSRAFTEGQDAATAQAYVDKNRLSR